MKQLAGINGFGRFGLHLLKYWLDRFERRKFNISYINDDTLSLEQVYHTIMSDKYVNFEKYQIAKTNSGLAIDITGEEKIHITYSSCSANNIPWIGKVDLFLECSGKHTENRAAEAFLNGKTRQVIISATSWDADKTLVYGFNHQDFSSKDKLISYGSCTVNAFIPLSNFIHKVYVVKDADVNIVHNIPGYKLSDPSAQSLVRKTCTLEKSAPNLLDFIRSDNFKVNYTLVPYDGVSIIDFRFRIKQVSDIAEIIHTLETACREDLLGLYSIDDLDRGSNSYICSPYSAVIIRDSIFLKQDNLYFMAYFDNENSVNRYFDLVSYICS